MPADPTPAEGVVAPLDPDFAEALIEKLTEIATRDDLKGRHVVFNTEVRSIATIVGVAAKVIGRPLAARPAAPTQSAAQTGEVDLPPISLDGPHRPDENRLWLSRQLLDSRLTAEEAYSVVAHSPAIQDTLSQPEPSQ